MHIKTIAALFCLCAAIASAQAQGTCETNRLSPEQCKSAVAFCRSPGTTGKECAAYVNLLQEEDRAEAAKQARTAQTRRDENAWRAAQDEAQAARLAEDKRQREADRERLQAEWDAEQARMQAEDEAQAQAEVKRVAALKAKCGADYQTLRVGMTISRVQACVTDDLQAVSEAATAKGTVTTYRIPSGYLRVMNGQVVQWGRFGPGQDVLPDLSTSQEPPPPKAVRPSV